jgi:hypothetical protein
MKCSPFIHQVTTNLESTNGEEDVKTRCFICGTKLELARTLAVSDIVLGNSEIRQLLNLKPTSFESLSQWCHTNFLSTALANYVMSELPPGKACLDELYPGVNSQVRNNVAEAVLENKLQYIGIIETAKIISKSVSFQRFLLST